MYEEKKMRKFDPSLYFITDSTNYTEEEFLYRVEQALKGGATLKCITAYTCYAIWHGYTCKGGAIIKCILAYRFCAIRNMYIRNS